jgi:hypothetical protein
MGIAGQDSRRFFELLERGDPTKVKELSSNTAGAAIRRRPRSVGSFVWAIASYESMVVYENNTQICGLRYNSYGLYQLSPEDVDGSSVS